MAAQRPKILEISSKMTRNLEIKVVDCGAAGAKKIGCFGVEVISGTPGGVGEGVIGSGNLEIRDFEAAQRPKIWKWAAKRP